MGAGGLASGQRRLQRSVDQQRTRLAELRRDVDALLRRMDALESNADSSDSTSADASGTLELDGGGA